MKLRVRPQGSSRSAHVTAQTVNGLHENERQKKNIQIEVVVKGTVYDLLCLGSLGPSVGSRQSPECFDKMPLKELNQQQQQKKTNHPLQCSEYGFRFQLSSRLYQSSETRHNRPGQFKN